MTNLVALKNKQATTTSLIVSEYFGKRHERIMRDIEDIRLKFNKHKNGVIEFKKIFNQ